MRSMDSIDYGRESVLVVEDEALMRKSVQDMLEHLGFRAESVERPTQALERLSQEGFTFLLTDIKLPEFDGLELIRRVHVSHPSVTSIAMTGYTKEYTYVDVVNAGAADFVNKPFGPEELEAKLRRAIMERNLREELNRLSITDALTGLYNRRYFYTRLQEEMRRSRRQDYSLGLLLLDLDDFKAYNDRYGHVAGDKALRRFGEIIKENIRESVDAGFRYGGDEFAILLVDADREAGMMIAERILEVFKRSYPLHAAAGFARLHDGMEPEDLVNEADRDLYQAKGTNKWSELKGVRDINLPAENV